MLSRVTSGRTPTLLIRLECIVRKLRKSTVSGKSSFFTVGFRCRRSKLRRFTGPPFLLVKTRSFGFRYFDRCQTLEFADVEKFFREVVDSAVQKLGCRRVEMGTDASRHGFMNVEIFETL